MKNDYLELIENTKNEIIGIKKWINKDHNKFDSKTRFLISYCVIKASGTIEVVFKHIIYDNLTSGANKQTAQYLEKMILDSSTNPNTGNMSKVLESISVEWKNDFDNKVKNSGKKDKINSLIQLRNDFAHGKSINVSIDAVLSYYEDSIDIINILDKILC